VNRSEVSLTPPHLSRWMIDLLKCGRALLSAAQLCETCLPLPPFRSQTGKYAR
jgi:hypothetical protein